MGKYTGYIYWVYIPRSSTTLAKRLYLSVYFSCILSFSDLQTIDQRLGQKYYKTLGEFIGDVMRIFENCRFFNPENSPITKSADNLENYFIQKLALLREKVSTSEN